MSLPRIFSFSTGLCLKVILQSSLSLGSEFPMTKVWQCTTKYSKRVVCNLKHKVIYQLYILYNTMLLNHTIKTLHILILTAIQTQKFGRRIFVFDLPVLRNLGRHDRLTHESYFKRCIIENHVNKQYLKTSCFFLEITFTRIVKKKKLFRTISFHKSST